MTSIGTDVRADGRSGAQLRPLECEQSVLNRADGSSRFSLGNSSVLVAVYGPGDVKVGKEMVDRATIDITLRNKRGTPGVTEKALEVKLRAIVESYVLGTNFPRTSISIAIQILRDDGALFACSVNGLTMALIDAGIPLSCMFGAISLSYTEDGILLVDALKAEEETAKASMTFVVASNDLSNIAATTSDGLCSDEQYFQALGVGRKGCAAVLSFMRLSLTRKVSRESFI
eukprot:CFRG5748T1